MAAPMEGLKGAQFAWLKGRTNKDGLPINGPER